MLEVACPATGRAATDANDRILYNPDTGVLRHDANGNADGGITIIARLAPGLDLGLSDVDIV
jgi:hypothetical protein